MKMMEMCVEKLISSIGSGGLSINRKKPLFFEKRFNRFFLRQRTEKPEKPGKKNQNND